MSNIVGFKTQDDIDKADAVCKGLEGTTDSCKESINRLINEIRETLEDTGVHEGEAKALYESLEVYRVNAVNVVNQFCDTDADLASDVSIYGVLKKSAIEAQDRMDLMTQ